ncbi:uncharacterized protein TNCV_5078311 [Trichonephila clavipes]|uniref:Uncharacterized protein n=1 Tax=Trichonephila clavipes TaxID=2585209 RepID=A0A8X6RYR0_TRICX|nr:uncharacterized protein TNCV_5078311 [Trichonephila clavipes]
MKLCLKGFHYWYDDTTDCSLGKLALGAGFELLRTFGLVRWGLGGSGHVEDCPLTVSPHKSLNSSRGVISEPDLIFTPETEILEEFSGQGVIQSRNALIAPNPIHQTQNCAHNGKPKKKSKIIKTNRNLTYLEARKLIAPQLSQSYAQVTKLSTTTTTTQTDENITKIVCPPLKLLQPLVSVPKPTISSSVAAVNKSSTSTQAELVPSTSLVTVASPSISQPPNSVIDTAPTTSNSLSISATSSSSTACSVLETTTTISNTIPATSQDTIQTSKPRRKKTSPKKPIQHCKTKNRN